MIKVVAQTCDLRLIRDALEVFADRRASVEKRIAQSPENGALRDTLDDRASDARWWHSRIEEYLATSGATEGDHVLLFATTGEMFVIESAAWAVIVEVEDGAPLATPKADA